METLLLSDHCPDDIQRAGDILRRADLYFDDSPGLTVLEMKGKLRRLDHVDLVIVDYLQILAAPEGKGSLTDKQAVDESLRVLKSLSDSRKLPVVLISSLNRESYDQPVSLRSYKDTGSIEYSCDTVLGMQYRGVGARDFDVFQAQGQNPRELEVCVLKQRYGAVGIRIPYRFYPAYSCFEELPPARSGKQPKGSKRQTQDDGILEV